jgi:integrase
LRQAVPGTYKDPGKSGFGLRVNKDGSATWVYRFRNGDDWPSGTLGSAAFESGNGLIGFEDAKAAFQKLRGEAQKKKRVHEQGMTFARGFDLYASSRISKRTELPLSPETLRGLRVHFKNDLAGAHDWHLETATSLEWQQLLMPVKERSPHNARRSFWLVHGLYTHLKDYKLIDCDNPLDVPNMRRLFSGRALKTPRTAHLQALDIPAFWRAVGKLKFKTAQEAIRLFKLLGWRRSAVLGMRWEQVNFEQGYYAVRPGDKGWKGYVGPIALSDLSMAVLFEHKARLLDVRPRTGKLGETQKARAKNGEEWVFPAYRGHDGPMREVRTWRTRPAPADRPTCPGTPFTARCTAPTTLASWSRSK